jgi:nucleotide-binding universal stress UspA family protein
MKTRAVLVPLDGSTHALDALPVAKVLAELLDATLRFVHIAAEAAPPSEVLERLGLDGRDLRGSVLDTKAGEPSAAIVEAAREARSALIVMCTHTAVARLDTALGRTALGVLKLAPCPVVLVRPERGVIPWALRRILLPHDGTPTTSAAIGPAAELARSAGAELMILHVAAPGAALSPEHGSLAAPRYLDQPQHEWPAWASEFVQRLSCLCPLESLKVRMSLARGEPGQEVARFAAEHAADLIVLAWRGEWEGEHAATAKAVIGQAPCPTMVIRSVS